MKLFLVYHKDGPQAPEVIVTSPAAAMKWYELLAEEDETDDIAKYKSSRVLVELEEMFGAGSGVFGVPDSYFD